MTKRDSENRTAKVLYVDPSLCSHRGHHANVCASTVSALRANGHHVKVLISRGAKAYLEGDRIFEFDVYRHMSLDPSNAADRRKLQSSVARFCSEIIPALATYQPDIIYAHSVGSVACEGIMRASSTIYASDHAPRFIAELPFPSEQKATYFYGQQLAEMFERLKLREPGLLRDFTPVTVNPDTSRLLSSAVGYDVDTMPSPYATTQRKTPSSREPGRPIRIGSVGHQAETKGFYLLPQIFESVRDIERPVEFIVQVQTDSDPATLDRLRAAQSAGSPIRLIEKDLDRKEYEALLLDLDVVLLPYQPARYISAISGVCYEALALGAVVIAPRNTTIGGLIHEFHPSAPLFDEWTSKSIAASLRVALTDFDRLQAEAQQGVDEYFRTNGPAIYASAIVSRAKGKPALTLLGKTPLIAKTIWRGRGLFPNAA